MADNKITFGGIDSSDYGIYIGGEGVFNAPDRVVEMIDIPGRNGSLLMDEGRFANIEVTYPAFNYETTLSGFTASLRAFRNALCSKSGYQRLTDSIHSDEFRLATYRAGLDVSPIMYNTASKFNIVFDCKPQRYLLSGTEEVTFTASGSITNPTLFASNPVLIVTGNGTVQIGDYIVSIWGNSGDLWIDSELFEYFIPGSIPEPLTDEFLDHITDELGFKIEVVNGSIEPRPSGATVSFANHVYPKIEPGAQPVYITGITKLKIIPRWWVI